ncbi:hypothetical protein DPMN_092519 [Dreissena polymorpha]|uniref:Uncharacterized protein n=1 Tax=Dreissena polymorpha TaxID=45954 RepID=A0A9D4L2G1_DREPO|nr:hypothetical protein DPMN_092519 [Dreissena polymorpha]
MHIRDEVCIQSLPYICQKNKEAKKNNKELVAALLAVFVPGGCVVAFLIIYLFVIKPQEDRAQNTDEHNELGQTSNAPLESHDDNIVDHAAVPEDITEPEATINTSLEAHQNDEELGSDSPWEINSASAEVSMIDGPGQTNTDTD